MAILGFLLLAVLLVLSPMVWLRPSRGESLRSRLRQHAKQHGGELNYSHSASGSAASSPLALPDVSLVGYRLRYPGKQTGSDFVAVRDVVASDALESITPQWRWRRAPLPRLDADRQRAFEAWLDSLPEDVLVVESRQHTLCVWWQERASLETFEQEWASWMAMRDRMAGSGDVLKVPGSPP